MIDIHTHILPMMDDGARNIEEAKALIALLQAQGVDLAVLTPHFYPHKESMMEFVHRRSEAYRSVSHMDLKMIPASETYLSETLFAYDSIEPLCIGETNHLLLELPYTEKWGLGVFRQIDQLTSRYRVCPIIAHVERYPAALDRKNATLQRLVDLGCLLQCNVDSVVEKPTRRATLRLIREGWVDFIGSDCHNMTSRPPRFDDFHDILRKKLGMQAFRGADLTFE